MKRTILLVIVLAWLLLPTGTPDDVVTFALMKALGEFYIIVVLILLALMVYYKINLKKIGQGMKEVTNDIKRWLK